ncbi:unnamed protein product [Owenia fusiformis]|uniref:Uncharacterized protein n=1 Tax=Owenia fusiformis TaxID=6347 RepID=A0A8J1TX87_OWEFU|nr:unnamed protein product [Owenia fusiformis]
MFLSFQLLVKLQIMADSDSPLSNGVQSQQQSKGTPSVTNTNGKLETTNHANGTKRLDNCTEWLNGLNKYEPTTFFRQGYYEDKEHKTNLTKSEDIKSLTFDIPAVGGEQCEYAMDTLSATKGAFIGYLSRICAKTEIHIGVEADLGSVPDDERSKYSEIIPVSFVINHMMSINSALKEYASKLNESVDVNIENGELNKRANLRKNNEEPVHNIVIGPGAKPNTALLANCKIVLFFNLEGTTFTVFWDDRRFLTEHNKNGEKISSYFGHFQSYLNNLISLGSKGDMNQIELLGTDERNAILQVPAFEAPNSLVAIFSATCARYPNSTALVSGSKQLTYSQLKEVSETIAKELEARIQSDSTRKVVIGQYLQNSIGLITSQIGIHIAGHAFLPLPVENPNERTCFTIKDAKARYIITDNESFENIKTLDIYSSGSKVSTIDDHEGLVLIEFTSIESDPKLEQYHKNEDLAYVMYTSGSTGVPKGIQVTHRGVANCIMGFAQGWELTSSDIVAQFASISFDASIMETYCAFFAGSSLVILDKSQRIGKGFIDTMNKYKITTISLTPSALKLYDPTDFPYVTKVISAGEACDRQTAGRWHSKSAVFMNAYGPTEISIGATLHRFNPMKSNVNNSNDLPIGSLLPNVKGYILDECDKLVPKNTEGELVLGGPGVALGYLGHAAPRNKESFISDLCETNDSMFYRSGDIVFRDDNDDIVYVGRRDKMVKLRSQRIELGEIERVFQQNEKVEQAVVVLHSKCSMSHPDSIVAFVTPIDVNVNEVRAFITRLLPNYMIPSVIKETNTADLPVTISGKIDRLALSKDETIHAGGASQISNGDSDGLDDFQKQVAITWIKVLKLDNDCMSKIGKETSFRELGGNSLTMINLQKSLKVDLNVELTYFELMSSDTLGKLADLVQSKITIS